MKNRKEFQELNRMAYPILLHYLLTSLFEILDQAIVGHYSVRGFAVVGNCSFCCVWSDRSPGDAFFGVSHYCGREDRKAG